MAQAARARWDLVRGKADELRDEVLAAFPNIDVECEDRRELTKKHRGMAERGYPVPQQDIDAYLLIRGAPDELEEAAQFAENQAAEISEQTGVWIEILATKEVWCKKSRLPKLQAVKPGQKLDTFPPLYTKEDKVQDIVFMCIASEKHDHDFGRLQQRFLAISR